MHPTPPHHHSIAIPIRSLPNQERPRTAPLSHPPVINHVPIAEFHPLIRFVISLGFAGLEVRIGDMIGEKGKGLERTP